MVVSDYMVMVIGLFGFVGLWVRLMSAQLHHCSLACLPFCFSRPCVEHCVTQVDYVLRCA